MSSFRSHLLSLSLLIGMAAPWAADAQAAISSVGSGSVEERITSLERISNAQAQLLQQLQQQLDATQSDIDSLRGQIQENDYQLNQVVERQKQIYQQIDSLRSGAPAGTGTSNAAVSSDGDAAAGNTASAASVQSDGANTDYNNAVALVLEKKQYDQAIAAFQAFIKKHPNSTYQPNANYWLGQLNYNKGKKDDAAYYFATVVKKFPKSPKSPDAMYKVGVIMQDKGDNARAKAVYLQVVKQYPNTEAAKRAQKRAANL